MASLRAATSSVLLVALLALGAPLAAATYPHLSEPRSYTFTVEGSSHRVDIVEYTIEGRTLAQVCLHRNLLCVGPYPIETTDIDEGGDRWMTLVINDTRVDVEYNESRTSETGPWFVEMPVGAPLIVCYLRCLIPLWTNATAASGYELRYYDNGFSEVFSGDLDANTTRALHPYVRPYDPNYWHGYPITLPRDAQSIARAEYDEHVEPLLP